MPGEKAKGRKTKYDPEITPRLAEGYAMEGFTDAEIADKMGIALSTFYKWQKQFSEFSESLKKGKEPVNAELKMGMVKTALGYFVDEEQTVTILDVETRKPVSYKKVNTRKYVAPSPTMQIFLAKNRMPGLFKDVNRHELTGKDGESIFPTIAELMMEDEEEAEDGEREGGVQEED